MSIDDTLGKIDALLATVEHHYQCEGCGRWHLLRPDISLRAKVECPCGERRDFNLADRPCR